VEERFSVLFEQYISRKNNKLETDPEGPVMNPRPIIIVAFVTSFLDYQLVTFVYFKIEVDHIKLDKI
jgi:hypothetical protein